jgi:hypothetical protein
MITKICTKCNVEKSLNNFSKLTCDKPRAICKMCRVKLQKTYYIKNKEERKIYDKNYRIKNKKKIQQRMKIYLQKNKEILKNKKQDYYLKNKIRKYYFNNNQFLNLSTLYEDDGKLTSQRVCLTEKGATHCIFCVEIRTYSDLYASELGHKPYLIFSPEYHQFEITIPKFGYLTKEDIANAIHYIVRENVWIVFNIKIDKENIQPFITRKQTIYTMGNDEIRNFNEYEKEK